jgi:hypothetical protein
MSAIFKMQDSFQDAPLPWASEGAVAGHFGHSFEEQGISCRRYCSLTTFCTFPLFVDLMKTLLVMFAARGSEAKLRFKLFIAIKGSQLNW